MVRIWREICPYQYILEQEGFTNMGMFLMSFCNMGALFSIQHVYII